MDLANQEGRELALISRAGDGNAQAFGQLYDQYVSRVFRHACYLVDDRRLAEDLTEQTFLEAGRTIRHGKMGGTSFFAWLLRILHSLTAASVKVRQYRRSRQALGQTAGAQGTSASPGESLETQEDHGRILQGVLCLRGDERHVFVLRFVDALTETEAAQVLGKSVTAIRTLQYRALSSLRRVLEG